MFTTRDTAKTRSSSQTVKVCVGADLTVSKIATPSFTRAYNWNITKKVTPALIEQTGGGTASASYAVSVNETGFTDSGWQVGGHITVTNPNDWEDVTADVTDAIDNGGICTVYSSAGGVNPAHATIPKSGTVVFPYTCSFSSNPSSGTNTATATWDKAAAFTTDGSAQGAAGYAFGAPTTTVHKTVTPQDSFNGTAPVNLCTLQAGTPCTLTAADATPFTSQAYTYSRPLNVPSFNRVTYPSTASIVETGQTASASAEACGPAKTGALTVSQMLASAASQSNAGGSAWYGQVKATQGLAKDAFDAINNQVAFSP